MYRVEQTGLEIEKWRAREGVRRAAGDGGGGSGASTYRAGERALQSDAV